MVRFKKGQIDKESFDVIMYDLGCLDLIQSEDNEYHMRLLRGNLHDIWGIDYPDE